MMFMKFLQINIRKSVIFLFFISSLYIHFVTFGCKLLFASSFDMKSEINIDALYVDTGKVKDLLPILGNFFDLLSQKDAYSASKDLFSIFPISQEAKDDFVNKITYAKAKLGNITGHEFVGFKKIGLSSNIYIIYWFSYHELMPLLWEFTFYKPINKSWQLNYIRFESDDILDFISLPRLQFEKIRSEQKTKN